MPVFNLDLLNEFRFSELFNELGWDKGLQSHPYSVEVKGVLWSLAVVAEKRGVPVLLCHPGVGIGLPDYATRQAIERRLTREVREHLIVFTDSASTTQIWQWVSRITGKPAQYREVLFRKGESGELLAQKLSRLAFALDEETLLTVLGVTKRLDDAKPRDRVTKEFYREFDKHRKKFAEFIDGIPSTGDNLRWYTAVLIDRLMFLWFLQEKGFLDGQKDYLRKRLDAHVSAGHSASFYKRFLTPLFFRGLAEQRTAGNRAALAAQFGEVPYLNGGLFTQHELEGKYGDQLDVKDDAFSRLFSFFEDWEWHLDDRPLRSGKEINPDVLGYIFEKFVNKKQMGAYYTKEDITEYIGKNTIIPCLLEKVRSEHAAAFEALAWSLLKESGDAYIYPAMLKGVDEPYPPDIAIGMDAEAPELLARRKHWNKRAHEAASLPTEIWRETIARHERTREVRAKITAGEINQIADLITYNLNIRQFAQDLIERCTDVGLLKAFWVALAGRLPQRSNEKFRRGLSVLDPTCGSGAFLFAALNILKPLYDATLRALQSARMDVLISGKASHPDKWKEIDAILDRFALAKTERAQDYAVIKHIIVNNLYGVDIEEQATEIAKLRLFLKLVALLEPGDDIEPLPDIDFNIRHGNTLVGYATAEETERAIRGAGQGKLFTDAWTEIQVELVKVKAQYENFQLCQVKHGGYIAPGDKEALAGSLAALDETLNLHLAREYGINVEKTRAYRAWKDSHQPFHWFVDFYPLMADGGFDVVIGNPPYVQLSEIKEYDVSRYSSHSTGNLYAVMLERCVELNARKGHSGFIVPVSSISTDGYRPLQGIYSRFKVHASSYDDRPSRLFDGLEHIRLSILLASKGVSPTWVTTKYHKWSKDERVSLFEILRYFVVSATPIPNSIPKLGSELEEGVFNKLATNGSSIALMQSGGSGHSLNYSRKVGYFLQVIDFVPEVLDGDGNPRPPSEFKTIHFQSERGSNSAIASLNSSLFYWFMTVLSDCRHLNKREIEHFPIPTPLTSAANAGSVRNSVARLMKDLAAKSETREMKFKHDSLSVQCVIPKKSWAVLETIDQLVCEAAGLSAIEADYVINYDIKYRLGKDAEGDDADE